MVKALITALLVVALAAIGSLLLKREQQPAAIPMGEYLTALLPKDAEGFASANAPWRFSFPGDHGAHPDYRTELWHFSGSLSTQQGPRFGFQLTFFRIGVIPAATPIGPSAWATRDLYWAQFTLTDVAGNRFHAFERFERAAMGLSGSEPSPVRVWLKDWSMEVREANGENGMFQLRAAHDDIGIELSLWSAKPPVIPAAGDGGRERSNPFNTFYAYVMTRLVAKGTIQIEKRVFDVEGHAWLDRAWGLVAIPLGPVVWDRFLLQLDDGRELMGLRLRRRDGSGEPTVTGMLVERNGSTRTLEQRAMTIDVLDHWSSTHDGTRFPARWRLHIPGEAIDLHLTPYVAAQERRLSLRSWAGTVRVSGTSSGRAIQGSGYAELAGYGETASRQ